MSEDLDSKIGFELDTSRPFVTLNGQLISKLLKLFKLDSKVYFTLDSKKLTLKGIDFQQCLGVIECDYFYLESNIEKPIYFSVFSAEFIRILESSPAEVKLKFHLEKELMIVGSKEASVSGLEHLYKFETSLRVEKLCKLDLIGVEEENVWFKLKGTTFTKVLKGVCATENLIEISMSPAGVEFNTHKVENKSTAKLGKEEFLELEVQDSVAYTFYYMHNVFSPFFKDTDLIEMCFFQNYLVIRKIVLEDEELKDKYFYRIYIPIKT